MSAEEVLGRAANTPLTCPTCGSADPQVRRGEATFCTDMWHPTAPPRLFHRADKTAHRWRLEGDQLTFSADGGRNWDRWVYTSVEALLARDDVVEVHVGEESEVSS